ncbi:hypothetical protein T09_8324 [Trichinella sp. T9]|nr:hypothetical protein T09_8324 [Trichinella sp. T9]
MLVNAERAVMHIRWIFVLWFSFPRYSEATSKCYNLNGDMVADCFHSHDNLQNNSARQFKRKNKYSNPLQLNAYTRILHTFSSKFQKNILQRVIWKKLKTSIKVWITRNKTLKSDCYILGRNIQLVASPIALISEPGSKFCAINKPYYYMRQTEKRIYRRVLVKKLKTNIKVWTTRDKILKSDCPILGRNIKLMLVNAERAVMHIRWIFVLWFSFPRYSEATSKCYNLNGDMKLKTSIKVWITRNKTLKSDCYILGRNIQLVASPIALISEPGSKFCAINKPYYYMRQTEKRIYRRVFVKKLKTNIKVWTTRDKILKSDCPILGRNIKLVASPIAVNGHASSLESDASYCLISDPGNKFCAVDKPYHKSQTKEAAITVWIDDATIFGHFNLINQNVENCA